MMQTKPVTSHDGRLERLLGGAEMTSLRQRMRSHFERIDNGAALNNTLLLTKLSPREYDALALLTGRSSRTTQSVRIDIAQLDFALSSAGIADSLRAALELIDGPIVGRKAIQARIQSEWATILALSHWNDGLRTWLAAPGALGRLKRLSHQTPATGRQLLDRANAVLQRLPANGIARSQLAAEIFGNAHALDDGEPTATVVLSVWRHIEGAATRVGGPQPIGNCDDDAAPAEEHIRDIWARAGVLVNELARPALFLNLPIEGVGMVKGTPGEPSYVSLRELVRTPPTWAVRGRAVFVCENPNLVAIVADRLGPASAPMVCTDGMPAAAQRNLLTQLVRAGAQPMYHGDFDWPGLHIGNYVMRKWQARPWRFGVEDYESAAGNVSSLRHELRGTSATAVWDGALARSMRRHGVAIPEEMIVTALLVDLAGDETSLRLGARRGNGGTN